MAVSGQPRVFSSRTSPDQCDEDAQIWSVDDEQCDSKRTVRHDVFARRDHHGMAYCAGTGGDGPPVLLW